MFLKHTKDGAIKPSEDLISFRRIYKFFLIDVGNQKNQKGHIAAPSFSAEFDFYRTGAVDFTSSTAFALGLTFKLFSINSHHEKKLFDLKQNVVQCFFFRMNFYLLLIFLNKEGFFESLPL